MTVRQRIRRRVGRARPQIRRTSSSSAAGARTDAKQSMSGQGGLMVGGVHDPAEKAADQMADRVMRMPSVGSVLHRKCEACEGEEGKVQRAPAEPDKEEMIQTKPAPKSAPVAPGAGAAAASPGATNAIRSMGSGKPMAKAERAFFEPRFGADLSAVRIHDGPAADKASRAVSARAFALGNDIAFASGERQRGGKQLMAHELAHVASEGHTARRRIRRLGDLSERPSGLSCPVPDSSVSLNPVSKIQFNIGGATLSPAARGELSTVAAGFHALGGSLTLRVDGFASTDGPDALNWTISCRRAEAVRNELAGPFDGSPGVPAANLSVFAQGETSEFSRSLGPNRTATVRSDVVFAPISCRHGSPETRATACIQPVSIAEDDGSAATAVPGLRQVADIWGRCCIDVAINPTITVNGSRFKEIHDAGSGLPPTREQRDLFALAGETNCVEVFFVDTIRRGANASKRVAGGGTTKNAPNLNSKIFVVTGVVPSVVAHELGHAFNVNHNLGVRADGQRTIAQPTGAHNRAAQPNVSDPICTNARANVNVTAGGGPAGCCKDLS